MRKWIEIKQYMKVIRRDYRNDKEILDLIDDLEVIFVDLAKEIEYLKKRCNKNEGRNEK